MPSPVEIKPAIQRSDDAPVLGSVRPPVPVAGEVVVVVTGATGANVTGTIQRRSQNEMSSLAR